MHNFSKLDGKMREARITQEKLASVLKIHPATLNEKLNGKSEFKLSELKCIANTLELSPAEVTECFFN